MFAVFSVSDYTNLIIFPKTPQVLYYTAFTTFEVKACSKTGSVLILSNNCWKLARLTTPRYNHGLTAIMVIPDN